MRVPPFLLALSIAAPLAAQPFIGAERPLAPYRDAPRLGSKYSIVGAGGSDGFLAAWSESGDRARIYGTRLTPDGKIAQGPFVIADFPPSGYSMSLRGDGSRYLLGVRDYNSVPLKTLQISPSGISEVGPEPGPAAVSNASGEHIVTSWEGDQFTITFLDSRNLLHGPPVRTRLVARGASTLNIRPYGDDWTILTSTYDGLVQWIRVDHTDVIGTTVVLPLLPYQYGRSQARAFSGLAVNGATASFAWVQVRDLDDNPASEWERVLAYTVVNMETGGSSETRIDTTRMQLPVGEQRVPSLEYPSAIFNGREFVYAWNWQNYAGDAEIRVVNGTGVPRVLARGHDVFPYTLAPKLGAGSGGRDLLLWSPKVYTSYNTRYDVLARPIDASSTVDDGTGPAMVSSGVTLQRTPREASGPSGTLSVWNEYGDQALVRGRFFPLSSNGGEPFTIAEGDANVVVAANADTFLVAWRELVNVPPYNRRLLARRYDANGASLDPQPIVIREGDYFYYTAVSVLPDGNSFVVSYSTASGTFVTRVPGRGAVTPAPVKIADTTAVPQLVRLAGRIVAVWISTIDRTGYIFKGARLKDTLAVESTTDMWLVLTKADVGSIFAVQANDQELLIALDTVFLNDSQECVRTRRFGLNLLPAAEASPLICRVYESYTSRMVPSVAWDGQRWWTLVSSTSYSNEPLRAWALNADGTPRPPLTITETQRLLDVSLLRTPLGMAALYTRADENAAATFRAFTLPLLKEQPKARSARH